MSVSLNKVFLIGYAGRDPELKYSQAGSAMANISLATDESYTDRNGQKVQRTEWHRITAYGKTAEICANYLSKGSLIFVEGSLQTRKWQDQHGSDRYTTEIKAINVKFLDRKNADNGSGTQSKASSVNGRPAADPPHQNNTLTDFDDVPF